MSRTPENVKHGQIEERIIGAALQLFTQHGYFNTSVPDVAQAAQVSVGSIYHYFKNKEDVARALCQYLTDNLQDELARIAQKHTTAHDRCHATIETLFELTETNRDAMEFMLYAKHREFLPFARPICSSEPFETMREFVQTGIENKEIRHMDIMVASSCLFGGALRLITARLDGVLAEPLPARLDATWECAWRGVAT